MVELDVPGVLADDFNVMPTELDVYKPERWLDNALFRPEDIKAYVTLLTRGWSDAVRHLHPDRRIYPFWKYWRSSL